MSMQHEEITKAHIDVLLNEALDILYENDRYLIDNRPFLRGKNGNHYVGERAIVFRLAHYMQNIINDTPLLADYVLDCEYNRNGIHAKKLPSFPNGVYPDIIIHNRGDNDHNLLVMEVKTYWHRNNDTDKRKIAEFLDTSGKYHFSFGISLTIEEQRQDVQINVLDAKSNLDLWG